MDTYTDILERGNMAHSEEIKKRAIELAPKCGSAAQVLEALGKEFPDDDLPVDEQTIHQWVEDQNVSYIKNIEEHWTQLKDMANLLLQNDVGRVLLTLRKSDNPERIYDVVSDDPDITELTHAQLTGRIEANIEYVCRHYSTWHMWECFAAHLEAEYPDSKDFNRYLYTQTSFLINALIMTAARKTFKSTCPVCKNLQ